MVRRNDCLRFWVTSTTTMSKIGLNAISEPLRWLIVSSASSNFPTARPGDIQSPRAFDGFYASTSIVAQIYISS